MSLRLFLTADVHIGPRPIRYPDEVGEQLREARFATLERMVQLATEKECRLLVVAGDLFESPRVSKADVRRAATILSAFDGVCAVLPGNHDYLKKEGDELWSSFREGMKNHVLLLSEPRPYPLKENYGIDAVLYPAPCDQRHSADHRMGWIQDCARDATISHHIGVAHGTLCGTSDGGLSAGADRYYPMTVEELNRCRLDAWLLGHIHLPYPARAGAGDRIYYSGTPEPDGFDCEHGGHAWVIELDGASGVKAESVVPGRYRFVHEDLELSSVAELARFEERWKGADSLRTLIKVALKGAVAGDDLPEIVRRAELLRSTFFHLELDRSALRRRLTTQEIDREFTPGFLPHRLLTTLAEQATGSQTHAPNKTQAQDALQLAYELLQEVRS